MSTKDLIERRLTDAFGAAHDDARWAGSDWTDPVGRVRKAARSGRTVRVGATVAGVAALSAGAVVGLQTLTGTGDRVRVVQPAGPGGQTQGSGRDWLLTPREFDAYTAAHPSPSPASDLVSSPAPSTPDLQQLEADVAAAMPAGTDTLRTDAADGGARGHLAIWLRLTDGTPVEVLRYRLGYPLALAAYTGPGAPDPGFADEHFTDPRAWDDGTAYSVITGSSWGYSVTGSPGWSGPFVWTATSDGWFTEISAPVSVDRLTGWAEAADAHFVAAG